MHLERTQAVAEALLRSISLHPSMKALEFGAGTGLLSFFLKEQFSEITLMDTSGEMLKIAESKLAADDRGKIKTLLFDLEQRDYTGEKFDIIFTQMVMHHIKDVPSMLRKFYGMLTSGGYLVIADLYSEDGSFHDPGMEVHHGFDPDELAAQMKACGFNNPVHHQCFVIRREAVQGTFTDYPVFLLSASR
jgi:ubiquinone/menaquinone biosynthesis C-methylase UbiE